MGLDRRVRLVPLPIRQRPRGRHGRSGVRAAQGGHLVYIVDGVGAHTEELARLGPHATGVGCLYLKDVAAVDLDVLAEIVGGAYRTLTAGVYTKRARDGGR